eukprot:8017316-Alexandrium_andersonii.AAC.1
MRHHHVWLADRANSQACEAEDITFTENVPRFPTDFQEHTFAGSLVISVRVQPSDLGFPVRRAR